MADSASPNVILTPEVMAREYARFKAAEAAPAVIRQPLAFVLKVASEARS